VTVAKYYGLSMADVGGLKLWEFNQLVAEMNREARRSTRKAGGRGR
jgi:hypothetical protein